MKVERRHFYGNNPAHLIRLLEHANDRADAYKREVELVREILRNERLLAASKRVWGNGEAADTGKAPEPGLAVVQKHSSTAGSGTSIKETA